MKKYDIENKQVYCLSININDLILKYENHILKIKPISSFQQTYKDINVNLPFDKLDYIKTLIDKITKRDVINNVKILDIFKKNDLTIYTIRYFLIDTKHYIG